MKKQIFGLQKNKVNNFFEKLEIDLSSQINSLETKLEELKLENNLLEEEILEQEEKIQNRSNDSEVWGFIQDRFDTVYQMFDEQKEREMKEMLNELQEKEDQINQQIRTLDLEIERIETVLTNMVQQSSEHLQSPSLQVETDGIEANNLLTKVEVAAGTNSLNTDQVVGRIMDDHLYSSRDSTGSVNSPENHSVFPSFWGDESLWSDSNFPLLKQEETDANDELINIEEEYDKKILLNQEMTHELDQKDVYQINEERENHEGRREYPQEALSFENEMDYQKEDFLEQIDSIKNKYIVGKVAGEDLFDHTGELILAKNSLITHEAVQKANKIGKLAELIVNMKLKGGGN